MGSGAGHFSRERALDSLTDEQLMNRLAEGEMESLGVLYVRYDSLVKAALVRSAPEMSVADVEELTHDVFLTVADKASDGEKIFKLRPWIYGIALRKARVWRRNTFLRLGLLKRHRRERAFTTAVGRSEMTPQYEMRETIARALENLQPTQRDVLLMHVVEGMSSKEIGRALDISPRTARTRLHRARRKLLSTVRSENWEPKLCKDEL